MSLVPKHIKNLKPYVAGKSFKDYAKEFGLTESIKLASNENPSGCSPLAINRVKNHLNICNRYPDSSGKDLRRKLAEQHNLKIDNVVLGAGSEGIMSTIMRTFLGQGDKIISAHNSFIGFKVLADASGYETEWVPMINYHYDLEAIASRIDKNTKIIYLANPDNPTGTYFTKNSFDSFMEKVPERVLIILDEAYYEYAAHLNDYPDSMIYRYDNIITLRTFSKIYGLAGFRIGYGFSHTDLISNLFKVKLPFEPSVLAQEAALGALDDEIFLCDSIKLNCHEKELMYKFLNELEIDLFDCIDSATNFITFKFIDEKSNRHFFNSLLIYGLIVRDLSSFGLNNCTRVTIGTKKENDIFKKSCLEILNNWVI